MWALGVPPHQTHHTSFCAQGYSHAGQERAFPKVRSIELSKMSLYPEALTLPFMGTKEPRPNLENPGFTIPPSFTIGTTHYLALHSILLHLPNPDLSVRLPDSEM